MISADQIDAFWSRHWVVWAPRGQPASWACHAVRHQVYCAERRWETGYFGFETDGLDARSSQGLLVRCESPLDGPQLGSPVGTVRLIHRGVGVREVSRFCVLAGAAPRAALGLIAWAREWSLHSRVKTWRAEIDPRLEYRLESLGISFDRDTGTREHNGLRTLVVTDIAAMFARCRSKRPDVAEFLDAGRARCLV